MKVQGVKETKAQNIQRVVSVNAGVRKDNDRERDKTLYDRHCNNLRKIEKYTGG